MKRELYEVFKDDFDARAPWRVQMHRGRMDFRTKRDAVRFAAALKRATEIVQGKGFNERFVSSYALLKATK
jgi:hypothetical protein